MTETATPTPTLREGQRTPWGSADYIEQLAPGIALFGTPSHGGIKLDRKRNAQIPKPLRRAGGWYEEDCEANIPLYFLASEVSGRRSEDEALRAIKEWFPQEWTEATGEEVAPEDSYLIRKEIFFRENADEWIGVAALNDKDRPGYVLVWAKLGGDRSSDIERKFRVKAEAYEARSEFGYIITDDDILLP